MVFSVCYNQFIDVIMIGYRSGPIGHVHAMLTCVVKRARVEGRGNVFPKQMRDFGNNLSVRHGWLC